MTSTILIVEDDSGLQKYLKELLLDNGFSAQSASDGIQALNSISKSEPDLVILDLGLPNMSGEAVCMEIRKKYPDLPVIILTAKDAVSDIVQDLDLDNKTLEVKRKEKNIQLTPQEFKLLQYLMSNKGRILTREMILNRVWLYSPDIETRVVDVYMGYLRKKIDESAHQKLLHSVRGFGYMIKD